MPSLTRCLFIGVVLSCAACVRAGFSGGIAASDTGSSSDDTRSDDTRSDDTRSDDTGLSAPFPGVYYSVGYFTGDLKAGAPTITIAGGLATLSLAQPARIGLGDIITYGAAGRAFITGRRSATRYYVSNAHGNPLPDLSAALVVSIRRAFHSLSTAHRDSATTSFLGTVDLANNDLQLNWVLYDDAPLVDSRIVIDSWITSSTGFLRIFTPVAATEVGVSQRHSGRAGTGV
ncbi:MAG: hypothetical protein JRH20_14675, partial [Deltaproteobacteria bacterium]|nr:hypothetical protein [Deltaproteobacteria bacterium]